MLEIWVRLLRYLDKLLYNNKMYKKFYILARKLRKNSTTQEKKLWNLLRNRRFHNLKFRRQCPIGKYIVDFVCKEKKLVIEIDGGQHNNPENFIKDNTQTEYLTNLEYKIVRFWNNDIDNNIEAVVLKLESLLDEAPSPHPSP